MLSFFREVGKIIFLASFFDYMMGGRVVGAGLWRAAPSSVGSEKRSFQEQFRKTKFPREQLRKTKFPRAVKKNEVFQEKFWVTFS
ncbi:MAG: hypothetical protein RR752_04995, partial [Mucinivorans sp.]